MARELTPIKIQQERKRAEHRDRMLRHHLPEGRGEVQAAATDLPARKSSVV
jgi:hypothetical protein